MSDTVEMTEAEEREFDAAVADPSRIRTREFATEIIDGLDSDIENIQDQLDVAKVEAQVMGGLSEARQAWLKRASWAIVCKSKSRQKVAKRLNELTEGENQ